MNGPPYFSIVIPVYNREEEIQRAIRSCLTQDFADFEIVVVDDASTDATREVVRKAMASEASNLRNRSAAWQRMHLVERPSNGGVCQARNDGVSVARGEWIIFLDSDDALLPDALFRAFEQTSRAAAEIGRFGFMYRWHDGTSSPRPTPSPCVAGYEAYLDWMEECTLWDMLLCTRRTTFEVLRLPESQATELEYHLDFAAIFRTAFVPEIVARQFADASERLTNWNTAQNPAIDVERMRDEVLSLDRILSKHGAALAKRWPRTLERVVRERTILKLTGERAERNTPILETCSRYWKDCSPCFNGLASVVLASLHPTLYFGARQVKRSWTGAI